MRDVLQIKYLNFVMRRMIRLALDLRGVREGKRIWLMRVNVWIILHLVFRFVVLYGSISKKKKNYREYSRLEKKYNKYTNTRQFTCKKNKIDDLSNIWRLN